MMQPGGVGKENEGNMRCGDSPCEDWSKLCAPVSLDCLLENRFQKVAPNTRPTSGTLGNLHMQTMLWWLYG